MKAHRIDQSEADRPYSQRCLNRDEVVRALRAYTEDTHVLDIKGDPYQELSFGFPILVLIEVQDRRWTLLVLKIYAKRVLAVNSLPITTDNAEDLRSVARRIRDVLAKRGNGTDWQSEEWTFETSQHIARNLENPSLESTGTFTIMVASHCFARIPLPDTWVPQFWRQVVNKLLEYSSPGGPQDRHLP